LGPATNPSREIEMKNLRRDTGMIVAVRGET
jgi:hypothetical protein